jgi:hypothetical protein
MVLTPTQASLTADTLQQAIEGLGLRFFRFHYTASIPHELARRLQVFLRGEASRAASDKLLRQDAGEQHLTVYLYHPADRLTVSVRGTTAALRWPAISLEGYEARTWHQFPRPVLGPGCLTSLFVYMANPQRIDEEGSGTQAGRVGSVVLETIFTENELVIAGSAILKLL